MSASVFSLGTIKIPYIVFTVISIYNILTYSLRNSTTSLSIVMSDNLDTLLSELSSFELPVSTPKPVITEIEVTDYNINEYILKRTTQLIDTSITAVDDIKDYIIQGQNPDEIAALSELINAATKSIEALNRINLLNKKGKIDKELKEMDLKGKKEVAGMLPSNNTVNNNLIVASREEIFKQLLNEPEPIEVVDSVVIEEKEDK